MKRIIPIIMILALLLSLLGVGVMASDAAPADYIEDDYFEEDFDEELEWGYDKDDYFDEGFHFGLAVFLVILLGIALPVLPIVLALVKLFIKGTKHPITSYITFIASLIWLSLGVVILILISI